MARGAYLRDLGNTPGHVNHWSKRSFVRCCPGTARSWRRARRSRGRCCSSVVSAVVHAPRAPRGGPYGRGARILSIGIATTGLVTFAYFSLASHALSEVDYKGIGVLWSVLFLIISIIYRPVEQLLSHTIASRRAQGARGPSAARAAAHPGDRAAVFLVVALALREPITDDVFDGSDELYWVLVVAVLAYAASYFARGWLAGHQRFGLYGGLVLLESCSRCLFALAVAIGIASGQGAVALGIAAAPLVSLLVVPWAIEHRGAEPSGERGSMREGAGFAGAVLAIMIAEQALLNGPVLAVDATAADAALAGFVFNVLLITRAPLQLFQAIQTSLLPHLSGLAATGGGAEFRARDPRHGAGDRGLRRGRWCSGSAAIGPVGDGRAVRRRLRLRARRADAGRARHGLPPGGRHAQPGGARRAGAALRRPRRGSRRRRCSSCGC